MDAALAVVRPKQLATISREFRSGAYEILLTDLRLPGQVRQIGKCVICPKLKLFFKFYFLQSKLKGNHHLPIRKTFTSFWL